MNYLINIKNCWGKFVFRIIVRTINFQKKGKGCLPLRWPITWSLFKLENFFTQLWFCQQGNKYFSFCFFLHARSSYLKLLISHFNSIWKNFHLQNNVYFIKALIITCYSKIICSVIMFLWFSLPLSTPLLPWIKICTEYNLRQKKRDEKLVKERMQMNKSIYAKANPEDF